MHAWQLVHPSFILISMTITGTHLNYYQLCHRKLWLFANGIGMEHNSDLVSEGRLVHESSYPQRSPRYEEVEIDGIKVDFYDARNRVIHEIKKSNKVERAHLWQLKYYIYVFQRHGIDGVTGVLEYPLLRRTEEVRLEDDDKGAIEEMMLGIERTVESDACPPLQKKGICRNCSYFEFCYATEMEE